MRYLLPLLLVCFSSSILAQSPWPASSQTGHTYVFHKGTVARRNWDKGTVARIYEHIGKGVAELLGLPSTVISPSYAWYQYGLDVMYRENFYTAGAAPFGDVPGDIAPLLNRRDIKKNELTGPNWIHLIRWIETEEARCLNANNKATGKWTGCPDPWQGGLQDDELVCFENKTYVKCQIECMERIHQHKIDYVAGACKAGKE